MNLGVGMPPNLQALQTMLYTTYPITVALGLTVAAYDGHCLHLAAPLLPNINDKETVFAGSLGALLMLAGWSLLHLTLDDLECPVTIVLQDSTLCYRLPVKGDFAACSSLPEQATMARARRMLQLKGKARVTIQAEIRQADRVAVTFSGRYVMSLT